MISQKTSEQLDAALLGWMRDDVMLSYGRACDSLLTLFKGLEQLPGNKSFNETVSAMRDKYQTRVDLFDAEIPHTNNRHAEPDYPPGLISFN
jgi:hypothetical protein